MQRNEFKVFCVLDENEFVCEVEKYYAENGKRERKQADVDGIVVGIRDFIKNSASGDGFSKYRRDSERVFNSANANTIGRLLEQIVNSRGLANGKSNRVFTLESSKVEDNTYGILGKRDMKRKTQNRRILRILLKPAI